MMNPDSAWGMLAAIPRVRISEASAGRKKSLFWRESEDLMVVCHFRETRWERRRVLMSRTSRMRSGWRSAGNGTRRCSRGGHLAMCP